MAGRFRPHGQNLRIFVIRSSQKESSHYIFGFKDTWTTLAPWNAIAVSLCDSDLTYQVNSGKQLFAENYREVAEKEKALLTYGQKDPVSQGYNDACTAFARGASAMFTIKAMRSQIKSVNPDMNIGSPFCISGK